MYRNFSKLLAVATLFSLLFTSNTFALENGYIFDDVDTSHQNADAISYLADKGVVQGYSDGKYRPDQTINRAEFLKIVMELSDNEAEGSDCYDDVTDGWYAPYVCKATELGFVKGYGDGTFRPGNEISFAEAAKIVAEVLELNVQSSGGSDWYAGYVDTFEDIAAIPNTIASFGEKVNRGEMAEMVWRIETHNAEKVSNNFYNLKNNQTAKVAGGGAYSFYSCEDVERYGADYKNYRYYYGDDDDDEDAEIAPAANKASGESAADEYSSTNVQVSGVDEADLIKNDGKYIYLVNDNEVKIVEAYPAESMRELDDITFADTSFNPEELYLDGDDLVVIGNTYSRGEVIFEKIDSGIVAPDYKYYGGITEVYVFDVSDKENIEEIRRYSLEGYETTSRKVGDVVYLVTTKSLHSGPIPLYVDSATGESGRVVECADLRYFPGSNQYLTISAIPLDPNDEVEREAVLSSSGNVYASKDSIYVAEYQDYWYRDYEEGGKTKVHKFSIDDTKIDYKGHGSVPGNILNQFSMDEDGNYFRIATTSGNFWSSGEDTSKNNLYVLDDDMDVVGKIEGIAPGEKIYSARFVGDRAYMVTFKKVDPFFVIDLSNPRDPEILGKLKIPGYSDYLHPLDEDHVIGFGKNATDPSTSESERRQLDFAWYQGMKIAMFDVSDVENPVELHKVEIGDRGTESEVLYNHKALLFDEDKGLMAFPVTVYELSDEVKNDPDASANAYGEPVFQGAYIYDVSVEDGFDLRGKISHYEDGEIEEKSGYYWYGDSDIERIIYIGEFLYTISKEIIKASDLDDLGDVSEVTL